MARLALTGTLGAKPRRKRYLAAAAILVLFGSTFGFGTAAQAATSPVTPLTVLPSTIVKGTTPTTGGALADASAVRMSQVYKFLTSPDVVAALKSQSAGTATKTETDLIASAARNIRIPTAVGGLVKGAGAAGVAYTGYTIGTSVGAVAGNGITTELWGVDANGLVCSAAQGVAQGFLSFFAGQDCAAFNAREGQVINGDATATAAPGFTNNGLIQTFVDGKIYFSVQCTTEPSGHEGRITCAVDPASRNQDLSGTLTTWCADTGFASPRPLAMANMYFGNSYTYDRDSPKPLTIAWNCAQASGDIQALTFRQYTKWGAPAESGDAWGDPKTFAWFADGAPGRPPQTGGNPTRYISCDIKGSDGSYQSVAGNTFNEKMDDWNTAVPACPTLPAEVIPLTTTLTLHTVGGADQVLWTHDTPAEISDALKGQYATCLKTVCQLVLEKNGVSCFDGADCTGWFEDAKTGNNTYTCRYAGKTVDLSECTVYKPSWEPDAIAAGTTLADPVTGAPAKNSTDAREQVASPTPGADSGQFSSPVQDPNAPRECFPKGWGAANPLNWVLQPTKCALEWAFVPRVEKITDNVKATRDAWKSTTPVQIMLAVGAWDFHPQMTGCSGIPVDMKMFGGQGIYQVANACPGTPLAPAAGYISLAITLLTAVGAAVLIASYMGWTIGFRGPAES